MVKSLCIFLTLLVLRDSTIPAMYNSTQYNTYYHEIGNGHECCPPPSTLSSPYNTSTLLSRTSSNLSVQNSIYHQQQQLEQTHNFYDQKDEIYGLHGGGQVRRVFSTEDTIDTYASDNSHNPFETVLSSGSSSPSSAMGRVGRYSAEERKERIERYRSKRIHRNFQKKITYECRKILADSRPRVRGRFARNGEPEMETEAEATSNGWCGWTEEEEKGMNTSMKSTSSSTMETTGEGYSYDSELWPSFVGDCFTFSNLISLD